MTEPAVPPAPETAPSAGVWDVLVVGGGNAGLCAAIAARQAGAHVLLVEKAPEGQRGGNSALTMNFRFPHKYLDQLMGLIDLQGRTEAQTARLRAAYAPYPEAAFLDDLVRTSDGRCDSALAYALAAGAWQTIAWLRGLGHCWEYKPTILPGAVPIRLKGGGPALQDHAFAVAERLGVSVRYRCALQGLATREGAVVGAVVASGGAHQTIPARAVVLACGGYQGSAKLRREHLGAHWENVALRGVPFNTGDGHRAVQQIGGARAGDYTSCHATPQDVRLAPFLYPGQQDISQSASRYAFNFGVTVNLCGERFFDEGADLPNFLYARLGAAIVTQPDKMAFQIFDSKTVGLLPRGYFTARSMVRSGTLAGLARGLGLNVQAFCSTIASYNAGAPGRPVDLLALDGVATTGVTPPKSNWAGRIDTAPYYGCPVRAGITFAYGGVKIDPDARVLRGDGTPIAGLFAAGEVAGGLFHGNYAGGTGLMAGAHFGRVAGRSAASYTAKLSGSAALDINVFTAPPRALSTSRRP